MRYTVIGYTVGINRKTMMDCKSDEPAKPPTPGYHCCGASSAVMLGGRDAINGEISPETLIEF
jgi:hypothetical protein